jgi:hypothetical protein
MMEGRSSMTIIEATEQKSQPYLSQLMKKLISNRCCLALLRFFVTHPNGRFSRLAIIHAIDDSSSKTEVEKALTQMVGEGILQTNIENEISFFLLTREETVRRIVLEMAEFDWRHWQLVLEHM